MGFIKTKKNDGFTVIEILFAFALFIVAIAEVVYILGEGQYASTLVGKNTIALTLAKEQMETMRNLSYAAVNSVPLTAYAAPYINFSYQITVTPIGALPGQIKDVVVTVFYAPAKQAQTGSVNLETYIGNY